MLRASIRIVAGQASEKAVGCELADRSPCIDPLRLPIPSASLGPKCTGSDVRSHPAPRRFHVIRRAGPAMTWLPQRSVDRIREKRHIYYIAGRRVNNYVADDRA